MPPKPTATMDYAVGASGKANQLTTEASNALQLSDGQEPQRKKKKPGTRKRRRNRRPSFISSQATDENEEFPDRGEGPSLEDVPERPSQSTFYRLGNAAASEESLDSEVLLDHRAVHQSRHRRFSGTRSSYASRPNVLVSRASGQSQGRSAFQRSSRKTEDVEEEDETGEADATDRTPLIPSSQRPGQNSRREGGYGAREARTDHHQRSSPNRRPKSPASSHSGRRVPQRQMSGHSLAESYDVNNPPSQPGSPRLGPDEDFDDVMLPEFHGTSPDARKPGPALANKDAIIDIDDDVSSHNFRASPRSPGGDMQALNRRRSTLAPGAEDVCIPDDQATDIGEDDYLQQQKSETSRQRRSRKREWPNLEVLEEWAQDEMEAQPEGDVRAKRVNEPEMVGGRLRPTKGAWSREVEDAPFRWTYFNEELDSSIRSHSISGLQQLGYSFRELFIPDPPELEDSSSDEDEADNTTPAATGDGTATPMNGPPRSETRQSSIYDYIRTENRMKPSSGSHTPTKSYSAEPKPKRYGPRPVFWLDVLQPTYEEMRVLSRAFGIHKLTAEDIMEQEAREKVELFRNYYFVNYRTFEQDEDNEDFMEAVNMYFIVFKGGVISFHFSQMPHPANVRRRIRQLAEHQYTDSDWIAYAIIDNITDAYGPVIEQIESQVDGIDDEILEMHSHGGQSPPKKIQQNGTEKTSKTMKEKLAPIYEKMLEEDRDEPTPGEINKHMLLRVGECRKKVMGMYRLLGNKADVIKGLAKRCNEQWEVAPRSDVGLYLGDIQDHIVTMTSNLTHYENILSRAHSNYLAQINIGMNERAEQTNDVLGKLTVLGTIVLPMNIVTGMWGMNVLVPGQTTDNLWWFFGITLGLFGFGMLCYLIAKRVYHLV